MREIDKSRHIEEKIKDMVEVNEVELVEWDKGYLKIEINFGIEPSDNNKNRTKNGGKEA